MCSEKKDADQLHGERAVDLHFCFKSRLFSRQGSTAIVMIWTENDANS